MNLADFIREIAASRMIFSSKILMIRLAVADHPMTMKEVTQALNTSRRQVYRSIEYLIDRGLVKRTNGGRHGGPACTYELTDAAFGQQEAA